MRSFKIKICGVTNPADAIHAFEAGADAIGLNFYERSLRSVTPLDSLEIVARLPEEAIIVGVFVNHPVEDILDLASHLRLDAIQLHGDETPEIMRQLDPMAVIRAVRVKDDTQAGLAAAQSEIDAWCAADVSAILLDKAAIRPPVTDRPESPDVAAILLDKPARQIYGGSGATLDWTFVKHLNVPVPTILAGGLDPLNVADAIAMVVPDTVDAASGIERFPGGKDRQLMEQFVKSARNAFSQYLS